MTNLSANLSSSSDISGNIITTASTFWKRTGAIVIVKNTGDGLQVDGVIKAGADGKQIAYVPNQTNYTGSLFLGDGGGSLDNTGVEAGNFNTYVGIGSGDATTIAKKNTALGYNAGGKITSGWANTLLGYNAGGSGVGDGTLTAGETAFYANTFIGESSGVATTTGSYNTAVGTNSFIKNTTGHNNCAFGTHAGNENTEGIHNLFIGRGAGYANTVGNYNVAIGSFALKESIVVDGQTAVGFNALYASVTGSLNTALGKNALVTTTNGIGNTALGTDALKNSTAAHRNTAVGYQSLYSIAANGSFNVGVGAWAGYNITGAAQRNIFIGYMAGNHGSQKVDVVNSIAIGKETYTTKDNQAVYGNGSMIEHLFTAGQLIVTQLTGSLTDVSPTAAEIDTITGLTPATAGAGWRCSILDSDGSGLLYLIESDGSNWQYSQKIIAV